jgi:hypothetical protein
MHSASASGRALLLACLGLFAVPSSRAATLVATYEFTNTLAADQGGVASLVAVDPLAQAHFEMDTVFGQSDSVYRFSGNANPTNQQGGLTLATSGLLNPINYSVEMVFSFDSVNGYRRILDVRDRQSDSGFYVDPASHLNLFPVTGSGPNQFSAGYHHVILTVAPDGTVKAYIDGLNDFTTNSVEANISNSATSTLAFFLDNVAAGGQGEYSSGRIAQVRLYDGVLTDSEALTLSQNPLVPEPAAAILLGVGALACLRRRRLG